MRVVKLMELSEDAIDEIPWSLASAETMRLHHGLKKVISFSKNLCIR